MGPEWARRGSGGPEVGPAVTRGRRGGGPADGVAMPQAGVAVPPARTIPLVVVSSPGYG